MDIIHHDNKAYSLLETILVLVVISLITLVVIQYYRQTMFKRDIQMVSSSVTILMDNMQEYFNQHCEDLAGQPQGHMVRIPYSIVKQALLIRNPFAKGKRKALSSYTMHMKIDENNTPLLVLTTNARKLNQQKFQILLGELRPSDYDIAQMTMTWLQNPLLTNRAQSAGASMMPLYQYQSSLNFISDQNLQAINPDAKQSCATIFYSMDSNGQ